MPDCTVLPSTYGFLNGLLGDDYPIDDLNGFDSVLKTPYDVFQYGHYIHFTSIGKPWDHSIENVMKSKNEDATSMQIELWDLWYRIYRGKDTSDNRIMGIIRHK